MILPQTYIGVDVSKNWIDVFDPQTRSHSRHRTTAAGLAAFARTCGAVCVVLEASGGYERPVMAALDAAGVAVVRVNPRHAREFARATGQLAKTDRVDAALLARMGAALQPKPTPPLPESRARLAELVSARKDLTVTLGRERNRMRGAADAFVATQRQQLIDLLKAQIKALEAEIAALIDSDPALADQNRRLQSVPGIGRTIAATIIARLPELGHAGRRGLASLAGLAPHACDSGQHRGKRHTWGGRADLRTALYQAAFIATRHDPAFAAHRRKLQTAGKPVKLAIVACARKLLGILNAMQKSKESYRSRCA